MSEPQGLEVHGTVGELVWAKAASHGYWPAQVLDVDNVLLSGSKIKDIGKEGELLVSFFGDNSYGWFHPRLLSQFDEFYSERKDLKQNTVKGKKFFKRAVEEAKEILDARSGRPCTTTHDPVDFLRPETWPYISNEDMDYPEPATAKDYEVVTPSKALSWLRAQAVSPFCLLEMALDEVVSSKRIIYSTHLARCKVMKAKKTPKKAEAISTPLPKEEVKQSGKKGKSGKKRQREEEEEMADQEAVGSKEDEEKDVTDEHAGEEKKGRQKRVKGEGTTPKTGEKRPYSRRKPHGQAEVTKTSIDVMDSFPAGEQMDADGNHLSLFTTPASGSEEPEKSHSQEPLSGPQIKSSTRAPGDGEDAAKPFGGDLSVKVMGDIRKLIQKVAAMPQEFLDKGKLGATYAAYMRYREAEYCRSEVRKDGVLGNCALQALQQCGAIKMEVEFAFEEEKGEGTEKLRDHHEVPSDQARAAHIRPPAPHHRMKTKGLTPGERDKDHNHSIKKEQKSRTSGGAQAGGGKDPEVSAPTAVLKTEVILKLYADRVGAREDFEAGLQRWHGERGHQMVLPKLFDLPLDLYTIFKAVAERGGFEAVSKQQRWKDILAAWRPELAAQPNTNYPPRLKTAYKRHLLTYEDRISRGAPQKLILVEVKSVLRTKPDVKFEEVHSDSDDSSEGTAPRLKMRRSDSYDGEGGKGGLRLSKHDVKPRHLQSRKDRPKEKWLREYDNLLLDDDKAPEAYRPAVSGHTVRHLNAQTVRGGNDHRASSGKAAEYSENKRRILMYFKPSQVPSKPTVDYVVNKLGEVTELDLDHVKGIISITYATVAEAVKAETALNQVGPLQFGVAPGGLRVKRVATYAQQKSKPPAEVEVPKMAVGSPSLWPAATGQAEDPRRARSTKASHAGASPAGASQLPSDPRRSHVQPPAPAPLQGGAFEPQGPSAPLSFALGQIPPPLISGNQPGPEQPFHSLGPALPGQLSSRPNMAAVQYPVQMSNSWPQLQVNHSLPGPTGWPPQQPQQLPAYPQPVGQVPMVQQLNTPFPHQYPGAPTYSPLPILPLTTPPPQAQAAPFPVGPNSFVQQLQSLGQAHLQPGSQSQPSFSVLSHGTGPVGHASGTAAVQNTNFPIPVFQHLGPQQVFHVGQPVSGSQPSSGVFGQAQNSMPQVLPQTASDSSKTLALLNLLSNSQVNISSILGDVIKQPSSTLEVGSSTVGLSSPQSMEPATGAEASKGAIESDTQPSKSSQDEAGQTMDLKLQ